MVQIIRQTAPGYESERISVLTLTRNRPEMFKAMARSFAELADDPSRVDIWCYVDDDDASAPPLIQHFRDNPLPVAINWMVAPRPLTLGHAFNQIALQAMQGAGYLVGFPEDFNVTMRGWDSQTRRKFAAYPDGIALGYIRDPMYDDENVKMLVVRKEWCEAVGDFLPPYFPFWFSDIWVDQLSSLAGRKFDIEIAITDVGGKGTTKRMWNMPFWNRFILQTAEQRFDIVVRLLERIHGEHSIEVHDFIADRAAIIERMRHELYVFAGQDPPQLVALELKYTEETTGISPLYLAAEQAALDHLRSLGQPGPVADFSVAEPVSVATQAAIVTALMQGASFHEVGASDPAVARRYLEWRNAYQTGFTAGWVAQYRRIHNITS